MPDLLLCTCASRNSGIMLRAFAGLGFAGWLGLAPIPGITLQTPLVFADRAVAVLVCPYQPDHSHSTLQPCAVRLACVQLRLEAPMTLCAVESAERPAFQVHNQAHRAKVAALMASAFAACGNFTSRGASRLSRGGLTELSDPAHQTRRGCRSHAITSPTAIINRQSFFD